jgi:hypothetical protein
MVPVKFAAFHILSERRRIHDRYGLGTAACLVEHLNGGRRMSGGLTRRIRTCERIR